MKLVETVVNLALVQQCDCNLSWFSCYWLFGGRAGVIQMQSLA